MKGKGQVRFLESTKRSVRARRVACDEADIPTRSRPLYGHTYSKSMDQPGEVATGKPYDGRCHTYPLIGVNIKRCLIILYSLYTLLYIVDFLNRNSNN